MPLTGRADYRPIRYKKVQNKGLILICTFFDLYVRQNKKRMGSVGACWESERSLFRKTKQMEHCNSLWFKINRWMKGSGTRQHRYFECFIAAAIHCNQSERSLFHGTKTNGTLLQRCKSLWHTQGLHFDDLWAFYHSAL